MDSYDHYRWVGMNLLAAVWIYNCVTHVTG
jgi:hypothetical protein